VFACNFKIFVWRLKLLKYVAIISKLFVHYCDHLWFDLLHISKFTAGLFCVATNLKRGLTIDIIHLFAILGAVLWFPERVSFDFRISVHSSPTVTLSRVSLRLGVWVLKARARTVLHCQRNRANVLARGRVEFSRHRVHRLLIVVVGVGFATLRSALLPKFVLQRILNFVFSVALPVRILFHLNLLPFLNVAPHLFLVHKGVDLLVRLFEAAPLRGWEVSCYLPNRLFAVLNLVHLEENACKIREHEVLWLSSGELAKFSLVPKEHWALLKIP
jgi:hypothetical protein